MTNSPRLQWFLDRIGKKVYMRFPFKKKNLAMGLIINSKNHADVLHHDELMNGVELYFSTKEEAEQFKQK